MAQYSITFDSPAYLLLLILLPLLGWWSVRSLAGLGRVRKFVAIGWRAVVMTLVILAVADMRLVRTSDRLTVIYLLDQSDSVPRASRKAMVEYTRKAVEEHRDTARGDRVSVIVFGRKPDIEFGPIVGKLPLARSLEAEVDGEFTDLEAAMTMARALFRDDAAKRVVIVTDGNENLGDALQQAKNLASAGIGIDVVPIRIRARADVAVEKVTLPSDVRQGQPFDLRVVLNNNGVPGAGSDGIVRGKLRIVRKSGDREQVLSETVVTLPPGKTVISTDRNSPETIVRPDFYTYEARFIPDEPDDDAQPRNNRATAYTHVRGRGQVLLIENWENPGEFDHLIETLKEQRIAVTRQPSNQLFKNLAELQRYDAVILANVPQSSGGEDGVWSFSQRQIRALVRNTEQMGCGLIMLGGENSFGAGGWTNTEIEKAMPVDFQIDNAKIAPVGALCLIMHAGEMADGNHWQQVVARQSIKSLGRQDYCGLLQWDWQKGGDAWLWGKGMVRVGNNRQQMLARLDRMTPGDMPEFDPSMRKAAAAFRKLDTSGVRPAIKHMIIISDGDPTPAKNRTLRLLTDQVPPVVVSTVAVGSHGWLGHKEMKRIAKVTGGKYYVVKNAKALPSIYQREVRRLARPLIFERKPGFSPQLVGHHEITQDLTPPPPITGFVLTRIKESPLVEVSMRSPLPTGNPANTTLLATWRYGLGRTVALTTDTGETSQGWANSWQTWPDYKKLVGKMVRWSMRPVDDTSNCLVATDVSDGKGHVIINAWGKDDEYLDFLNMTGSVVGPDMEPRGLTIRQVAPGRYVGDFDATDSGSYMVVVNPGRGQAPIRTGVNVPYSAEYRDREANLALLEDIVRLSPKGGEPGLLIADDSQAMDGDPFVQRFNSFRHDLARATHREAIWPVLLFVGACLFFCDVFFRRVQVSFGWLMPMLVDARDRILRREEVAVPSETIARLRGRKAEVADSIEQRRAAHARFEPHHDVTESDDGSPEVAAMPDVETRKQPSTTGLDSDGDDEEDSYTERLLKAKRLARRDHL